MNNCPGCGIDTINGDFCGFCRTTAFSDPTISAVYEALSAFQSYADNPVSEPPKRPPQISINEEDINDVLKMNGFVKDVIDVAIKQMMGKNQNEAARALKILFDDLNSFNEDILEHAKKFAMNKGRFAPILFSTGASQRLYNILDFAESLYGKFIRQWFLTKQKKDWAAWRKIFYECAWHLGSFVRKGRPAKDPSPWILGTRPPLEDDPFGPAVPIGKEKKQR